MSQPSPKKPASPQLLAATGKQKQFLEELAAYADAQRKLIEAECTGFATDKAAVRERRVKSEADFRFFSRTYFPHYVKSAESLFHTWFYDHVPDLLDADEGRFINISAPRGEAKSTLGTQLLVLWCIVTSRKHFIPIVMDAGDQAATMLEAIKTELTDNPRLSMDFPEACGQGRVWNVGIAISANNVKVQAFGSGKKMRGLRHGPHRPDLVVLDDIENDENVRQKTQRDKTHDWVNKTVLNLGPPDGTLDVLYLNTILAYDSVANRFHKTPGWIKCKFKAIMRMPDRMDLWDQWEELYINQSSEENYTGQPVGLSDAEAFYLQNAAEMEQGAILSWPSVRPLLYLMKIRAKNHRAFDSEYQNDPTNDESAVFTNMQFWVQRVREWVFYGVLDPSLGKVGRKGDPAALLVGGWDRHHGKLSIVEAVVARMTPDRQLSRMIEFQRLYNCLVWGVEDTAFQAYFLSEIIKQSAAQHVPIPALAIRNEGDKDLLIEAVSPHVNNGLILFHQSHTALNSQVRHWPEADHDDGPDAVQMLWKLALSGAGGVPRMRFGKRS